MIKSLENQLELISLAETIQVIGYRAKVENSSEPNWIVSSAGGYKIGVVAFTDGIKLRAIFDYISEVTFEVINKFNADNRLCKLFVLGETPAEWKLSLDLDSLTPSTNFEEFLLYIFQSYEIALAAFARLVRELLETKKANSI